MTIIEIDVMGNSARAPLYKLGKAKIAIAKTINPIKAKVAFNKRVELFITILSLLLI